MPHAPTLAGSRFGATSLPLVVLVALAALGCKSRSEGAREWFANNITCPVDRVTVRERPDLDPGKEMAPQGWLVPHAPSKEVASDPGRLDMWNKSEARRIADVRASYSDYALFEVSGCDQTRILGCRHFKGSKSSGFGSIRCDESERAEEERKEAEREQRKPKGGSSKRSKSEE